MPQNNTVYMKILHIQLKILLLLLIVVLFVVAFERKDVIKVFFNNDRNVAAVITPVKSFLGVSTEKVYSPTDINIYSAGGTNSKTTSNSLLTNNFFTSLFRTSPTVGSDTSVLLICIPGKVEEGEKAIIMWACRDNANSSTSNEFDTGGSTIGSTRIQISKDTTIKVDCILGIVNYV